MMRRVLAASLIVVALAVGSLTWIDYMFSAPGPAAEDRVVVLPRGAGLDDIARRLARAGVIGKPWLFRIAVRLSGDARGLQAGEFRFAAGLSAEGVMNHLLSGRPVARRLTVPEVKGYGRLVLSVDDRWLFWQSFRQRDQPEEPARIAVFDVADLTR